ncbi:MAG: hypothetical protein Ct9H90mP6_11620 [Gammaproteobacteria bacterium]|nr:MAG: hypothetical protein Ct9H90mP6_11620 [Gammaproteobacteria bacterium]
MHFWKKENLFLIKIRLKILLNILFTLNLPSGFLRKLSLFGISVFFIYFGIDHFINPEFYLSIMPPNLPFASGSGIFEWFI